MFKLCIPSTLIYSVNNILLSIHNSVPCMWLQMDQCLKRTLFFAATWRILLTFFQTSVNSLFEDFDSSTSINTDASYSHNGSRNYLLDTSATSNWLSIVFNGLNKWDSVYIVYIAQYGYVYEQMMAFFPAFPFTISVLSYYSTAGSSAIQIFSFILNFLFFLLALYYLYKLTWSLSNCNPPFTLLTCVLFVLNPATIFMMASYTEAQFVFLQFGMMFYLETKQFNMAAVFIAGTMVTRSNGILNIVFLCYFMCKNIVSQLKIELDCKKMTTHANIFNLLKLLQKTKTELFHLLVCITISISPFVIHQTYVYKLYCGKESTSPDHWCRWKIPISYSYIQRHYWNVGLFRYYEFKQIPNFILAAPTVCIVFKAGLHFYNTVDKSSIKAAFGFIKPVSENNKKRSRFIAHEDLLVYLVHALFITLTGLVAFHVQILTRMICSSTPVFYWSCAAILLDEKRAGTSNRMFTCLCMYFMCYVLVGTLLHTNFYPWT